MTLVTLSAIRVNYGAGHESMGNYASGSGWGMVMMKGAWFGRNVGVALAMSVLVGCGAMNDPQGPMNVLDAATTLESSDRALAAMTRGDYTSAERLAIQVLRRDPKDPVSLLVAGVSYQAMGRYDLARQYYEVIITNQNQATIMVPGDSGIVSPHSVLDMARSNLAVIDKTQGRGQARSAQESGRLAPPSTLGAPPLPIFEANSRPVVNGNRLEPIGAAARITDADANVAGRFRIMKRLLDEGLVAPDEYSRRRAANLGALLPYSVGGGASGLERPTPQDQAIITRLKDIAQTLETRATSPAQHAAERAVILDALLPVQPRSMENPPPPLHDMIEASAAVGRVEKLKAAGLISDAEGKKERDSIEKSLDSYLGTQRVAGGMTSLRPGTVAADGKKAATTPAAKPTGWGVVLSSSSSEEAAKKSLDSLKAKFPEELGTVSLSTNSVQGKNGQRWRVVGGPLAGKDAAAKLCKTLKLHRQSCDPIAM